MGKLQIGEFKRFSRRETTIFKMLITEHRSEEIAKALNLSEKTIGTYKFRLLAKTKSKTIIGLYLFSLRPDIEKFFV